MMRTYDPRDTKVVDELDPCIAAEIRAKNDHLFKKSHKVTIIVIAILITLICAAAVFMIIFLSMSQSEPSAATNSSSDYNSEDVNASGFVGHPKNRTKSQDGGAEDAQNKQQPQKAHAGVTVDREALPPPTSDDSVIPMNRNAQILSDAQLIRQEPDSITVRPTKAVELVTYSTKSDEIPDSVPSFNSINDDPYDNHKTDDIFEDCGQYRKSGHKDSGVFDFKLNGKSFKALCLMQSDQAWMVLQRRTSDSLSFHRSFEEYANGFGSPKGDHWLGLEKVHEYVKKGYQLQLRIELRGDHCADCSKLGDDGYWWGDWTFAVGSKDEKYKLDISPMLHGNLSDEFYKLNNGHYFTTYDQDNDGKDGNCALYRQYGAWWHNDCTLVALNGAYGSRRRATSSMVWFQQKRKPGNNNVLESFGIKPKMSLMMFRILKAST